MDGERLILDIRIVRDKTGEGWYKVVYRDLNDGDGGGYEVNGYINDRFVKCEPLSAFDWMTMGQ